MATAPVSLHLLMLRLMQPTCRSAFILLLLCSGLCCNRKVKPVDKQNADVRASANEGNRKPLSRAQTILERGPLFAAPKFELTDQNGHKFGSEDLIGRVWIVNFMFTHCQATCPRQTARLAELQTRMGRWPNSNRVRFLSITVDPARDTPERLREYADSFGADPERWKFLTGDRAELWRISSEGFKLPVAANTLDTNNPITHSSRFMLVDSEGQVCGIYESLSDEDVLKLVEDTQLILSVPALHLPEPVVIGSPGDVFDPAWLGARQAEQLAQAKNMRPFHDFQFVDQNESSGITFVNHAVADAAKHYKSNHYDHANGVSAADVDGDGLVDLYFTSQHGGNGLWRNVGNGQFENITEAAGVALYGRVSVGASFADTDNDGDADLYVTTTRFGNAYFVNDGRGRFTDRTEESGLAYKGHSSSADFFDYDHDGQLDLLLTNVGRFTADTIAYTGDRAQKQWPFYSGIEQAFAGHLFPNLSEESILYHNEGDNRFRDARKDTGLRPNGWSGDATPIDINHDGWQDLYVLNMQGNDVYYENQHGSRFVDRSRETFPQSVWGGMGVKSFDYNNDGRMDFYVTNMHADMWELQLNILGPEMEKQRAAPTAVPESYLKGRSPGNNIIGNALFVAQATGGYTEIATKVNAENYWPWGPSVADLNADGYEDIFVATGMNYPFRYQVNSVLLNDQGEAFRDAEFILGVEPRAKTAVPWFRLDASGKDARHALSQGREGKLEVWGAAGTRSAVIFDLDGDGDLDIVTNDFNSRPMVLLSNLSERNPSLRYLSVELRGTKSNRDALGATVAVTLGHDTLTQVLDGQSGYLSQSCLPLYFGLGTADTVDKITVTWVGGRQQVINGPVQANQSLLIVEK